jgi:hypothetical protein
MNDKPLQGMEAKAAVGEELLNLGAKCSAKKTKAASLR